ncbi:LCP family protein [Saccharomonospora cyanea]|uniref:Cell envelope-related function transcriptional attenuator common domain n=1 Tax=Saccharomonospora cyanea NA-134 TaxID=882082 RepID=H5XPH4_9PSEU|nr:LCP family protein [Saccharomonospora cyanea]EHR60021.1 cell envelope-related function transcriptional attenuator common domain [Saccharomonospora cyanea NA-134]
MTGDRTESLIREALAHEAGRAVDPSVVRTRLSQRGPRPALRRRPAVVLAAAAVVAVAIAAVITPRLLGTDPSEQATTPATSQSVDERTLVIAGMDGAGHPDAILLARVRPDGASVVSLPRDAGVTVPGHGQHPLNSAYQLGRQAALDAGRSERDADHQGATLLVDTVAQLTGEAADHYVLVDTDAVGAVATAVGGVEVCVREAQHDPTSGADLEAGRQTLSGEQALAFLRQRRNLPRGDLDRMVRLQVFAQSLFDSVGNARGDGFSKVAEALAGHVRTDPELDVLGLAEQLATWDRPKLATATIPVGGAKSSPGDSFVLEVDEAKVREFVGPFLDGQAPEDGAGKQLPDAGPRCVY